MIKVIFLLLVSMILGFAERGLAQIHVDSGVGNGGDPLRGLFSDARTYAAQKAQKIKTCSFDSSVPRNISDWIIAHRPDYTSDILRSQQIWITDQQPTCAWTHDGDASDITLSFEACRPLIKSVSDAAQILFHESVHHFGITDENFAEAVANAMDSAQVDISCPMNPQDPFDPDACPGHPITTQEFLSYFSAGGSPVNFSQKVPVIYRYRKCLGQSEDQCTEWAYRTGDPNDISLGFSIQSEKPVATLTLSGNLTNYNTRPVNLMGIGTSQVVIAPLGFAVYWEGPEAVGFLFEGKGRLTNNCLVQRIQVNKELEAGFILQYY